MKSYFYLIIGGKSNDNTTRVDLQVWRGVDRPSNIRKIMSPTTRAISEANVKGLTIDKLSS